jgi:hypothetical protein
MDRREQFRFTRLVLELSSASTGHPLLDSEIAEVLGVTPRDYTRKLDDALALVPEGCGVEIVWDSTPLQSTVVITDADLPDPSSNQFKSDTYNGSDGTVIRHPLELAICLCAVLRELSRRERAGGSNTVAINPEPVP